MGVWTGHSEDGDLPVCDFISIIISPQSRFVDLVSPSAASATDIVVPPPVTSSTSGLTEEEERELAELMDELGD